MQNASSNKSKSSLSWRQRNRINLQTVALGLGLFAPFVLLFAFQSDQTLPAGICFALAVAAMIIVAWMG
jgi:hypothetical protein